MSWTLSLYVGRRFLLISIGAFLAVFALVVIVGMIELMGDNRAGAATFSDLLGMALMRAPSITITAAPFAVLLSSMACFAWLARSSELVVTRSAGVSGWGILIPALIVSILLGTFSFAVYNPIASAFASRFEQLEEQFFGRSSSRLSVSPDGLWLRQGDQNGQTVIRAQRASRTIDRLWDVNIFKFDSTDRLFRRIDARTAVLMDHAWRLNVVRSWDLKPDGDGTTDPVQTIAEQSDGMVIPTDLTPDRIMESFAAPQTISFWDLPKFIKVLEQSGFSSNRHRLYWHGLLSAPVVFLAMSLIGAAFSMRHVRFGGLGFMALACVLSGFGYFFLSDISHALGASGSIPVILAAWGPPVSAVLFALGLLLHFEGG